MGVYARPDSRFWWYWIEGTTIRGSTGVPRAGGFPAQDRELRRQAEEIYAAKKTDAAKRAAGLIPTLAPISYAEHAAWFEAHDVAHHRGADKERSMLRQLALYFNRFERLADIDEHAVKEWRVWRGRHVEPNTINRELDVLKRLMVSAVPKHLEKSPIAGMRRLRVDETEPRVLTHDEEARILEAADLEDRAWFLTAIDTLMRLGNVVGLKWAQVKLEQRAIVPLNAKVKHDVVPITTRMLTALKALPQDTDWVFPRFHKVGERKTAAKNKAIRRFDYLCRAAHVPHGRDIGGVTFHCIRHTGATRALQRGASVRTVMKLGGWKDERTVMRYVHAADSDVRAAAETIGHTPHSRRA